MSVIKTSRQKKLAIQVNTGTSGNPTLKNRSLGSGYWINPDETTATDEKLYQLGTYFAALQAHELNAIKVELKSVLVEE